MKPAQAIGYTLLQTTAVTTIVSTRVWHGLRPEKSTVPSINYFEIGGPVRWYGVERQVYSINCRASSAGGARDLARTVVDLFQGDTGIRGTTSSFTILRSSLQTDQGLIPEVEDGIFNAPVDILFVYPSTTVS